MRAWRRVLLEGTSKKAMGREGVMHVSLQQRDPAAVPSPTASIPAGATPERGGAPCRWAFVSSTDTSPFSSLACPFAAFSHLTLID